MKLSAAMTAKVLALAGAEPPKRKRVAKPKPPAPLWWSITFNVPTTVVSEVNRRDHWRVKRRRAIDQKIALGMVIGDFAGVPIDRMYLKYIAQSFGVTVTFVRVGRIGHRQSQDDDNIRSAFKALRDDMASRMGVDDGDWCVTWQYEQRAGEPGVELRIEYGTNRKESTR